MRPTIELNAPATKHRTRARTHTTRNITQTKHAIFNTVVGAAAKSCGVTERSWRTILRPTDDNERQQLRKEANNGGSKRQASERTNQRPLAFVCSLTRARTTVRRQDRRAAPHFKCERATPESLRARSEPAR